jgi:hypothetical protein
VKCGNELDRLDRALTGPTANQNQPILALFMRYRPVKSLKTAWSSRKKTKISKNQPGKVHLPGIRQRLKRYRLKFWATMDVTMCRHEQVLQPANAQPNPGSEMSGLGATRAV